MNNRPSEFRSGLPCPSCGRSLVPVTTGTDVIFHCKTGHAIPLLDLLSVPFSAVQAGLQTLLLEWSRQFEALKEGSEDARKNGFFDIAAIFARRADSLRGRIEILQAAFAKSESSKLLKVPSCVRDKA